MKIAKICVLNLLVFILSCSTGINRTKSWSDDEKLEKHMAQSHHWGQQSESSPNNGWSEYKLINLYNNNKEKKVYKQDMGEFFVSIVSTSKNVEKFRALSIPGAGIFYSPKDNASCMPDNIEILGLELEFLLHIISKAFPEGPTSIL